MDKPLIHRLKVNGSWHSRNGWTTPDVRYSVSTSKHQGRIFTAVEYVKNGSSAIGS
jgi:hypothetical protein